MPIPGSPSETFGSAPPPPHDGRSAGSRRGPAGSTSERRWRSTRSNSSEAPSPCCLGGPSPRKFEIDVLACPGCGGRLRLLATIEDPTVARNILAHLGISTECPQPEPARPPPWVRPASPELFRFRQRLRGRSSAPLGCRSTLRLTGPRTGVLDRPAALPAEALLAREFLARKSRSQIP